MYMQTATAGALQRTELRTGVHGAYWGLWDDVRGAPASLTSEPVGLRAGGADQVFVVDPSHFVEYVQPAA